MTEVQGISITSEYANEVQFAHLFLGDPRLRAHSRYNVNRVQSTYSREGTETSTYCKHARILFPVQSTYSPRGDGNNVFLRRSKPLIITAKSVRRSKLSVHRATLSAQHSEHLFVPTRY